MSGTTDQFEGGCLCGAVRFVATGKPKDVAWCHCESCRKHSGAPVSVFALFERTDYTITKGEITKFDSTPGKTRRGFCARCGSTLTCESLRAPGPPATHFHIGAFDQAELFEPTRHIFPEERLSWLHTGDA
ncbi:MAG: GFA family protein [Stellaceae bacterium]